jgi:hypothetical protein
VIVVYTGTYLGCIALATIAVSEPPETVNQSNQDNTREESHTNTTDNSNLQGNVDENKGYKHRPWTCRNKYSQSETKIVEGTLNILVYTFRQEVATPP